MLVEGMKFTWGGKKPDGFAEGGEEGKAGSCGVPEFGLYPEGLNASQKCPFGGVRRWKQRVWEEKEISGLCHPHGS